MRSVKLRTADMKNMMQTVLMRMEEMQNSLKESQMENQRNMEGLQITMMEEFRKSRIQNLQIRERLQKTNRGPEGRIEKELSQEIQHCCSGKQTEIKILPLIQESTNDNDVSVEVIQDKHVNEDQMNANNSQVTECEPEDRVVNSQVKSCFDIPYIQNKMERKQ
jgi:hypothetical protein